MNFLETGVFLEGREAGLARRCGGEQWWRRGSLGQLLGLGQALQDQVEEAN